jgi:hypothetical protein
MRWQQLKSAIGKDKHVSVTKNLRNVPVTADNHLAA